MPRPKAIALSCSQTIIDADLIKNVIKYHYKLVNFVCLESMENKLEQFNYKAPRENISKLSEFDLVLSFWSYQH